MSQPIWKLLYATDTEALYEDTTKVYDPELAILDEYITKRGTTKYYVFRFPLPQCQPGVKAGVVCDDNGNAEWFSRDLADVVKCCDHPTIVDDLCSSDVKARARAYASIGRYHGFDNFDSEPQNLPPSAVSGWPDLDGKAEVRISTSDDDDGMVTLYCDDPEAARDAGSPLDSSWEFDEEMAYCKVMDRADLVTTLEAEGYDVDSSEWAPPDEEVAKPRVRRRVPSSH